MAGIKIGFQYGTYGLVFVRTGYPFSGKIEMVKMGMSEAKVLPETDMSVQKALHFFQPHIYVLFLKCISR